MATSVAKKQQFRISAAPSAYIGQTVLALVVAAIAGWALRLSPALALAWGALFTVAHITNELIHQGGHAIAARRTGYPMRGIRMIYILAASLYPKDEPPLPARIHIRRALGGPIASALLSVVYGVLAWLLRDASPPVFWFALMVFLNNLLVFTLGAFLPLSWTDGGTLLRYWPERNKQ